MTTIIRATDENRGIQSVAFNFDDMTAKANEYLAKVRAEALQIVAKAQQDAAAVKQKAVEEGRAEGMRSVEQIVQKQLATALPALRQAIGEIQDAKQAWQRHWEATAVHVAAAIAKRVIRRELTNDPQITVNLVREALNWRPAVRSFGFTLTRPTIRRSAVRSKCSSASSRR